MPETIALLRAVNVGGRHKIRMEELRALFTSLGLRPVETYVQSGNVVFGTRVRDLALLTQRIEKGIERRFGFRPRVILRTASELKDVIGRNPFAARKDIHPSKLLVTFLSGLPRSGANERLAGTKTDREEMKLEGCELFIYFPDGSGRSKLSPAKIEKALGASGTARNWNTVTKLFEMAKSLKAI